MYVVDISVVKVLSTSSPTDAGPFPTETLALTLAEEFTFFAWVVVSLIVFPLEQK